MHGPYGEDGTVQGVLEYSGVNYVGCNVLSSAICMDKGYTKDILKLNGINQPSYLLIKKKEKINFNDISFDFPIFVKPVNLGSSIGISKVCNKLELEKAIDNAFLFSDRILIEKGIDAREIEVAILDTRDKMLVSRAGELIINNDFYDYDTKYNKDTTVYKIPADIENELEINIRNIAKKVYNILGCRGLARIDFFINKENNEILVNEINTLPGFTKNSMYPKLMESLGYRYTEIITKLIEFALEG